MVLEPLDIQKMNLNPFLTPYAKKNCLKLIIDLNVQNLKLQNF